MTTNGLDDRGFTLIELVISLTMGVIVLGASMSFAISTLRGIEGNYSRDQVNRNGRFVAMSLERDFQSTGVGMASTITFGSLAVWGDTIVILHVAYDPLDAPPYDLDAGAGTSNPLPPGGTCGSRCLNLTPDPTGGFDLQGGDLARLQVNGERRLILVTAVTPGGANNMVEFSAATQLLRYTAGLSGGLQLDRFGTFVQKLGLVAYWVESGKLMRAERLNPDGTLAGDVMANGVLAWDVDVVFTDGDIAPNVNLQDSDLTNDFDDLVGVQIRATLGSEYPNPHVNGGSPYTRAYEWRFAPRNLRYERNRI